MSSHIWSGLAWCSPGWVGLKWDQEKSHHVWLSQVGPNQLDLG